MITVTANRITTNVQKFKYPDTCVGIDIQVGSQPIDYLTGMVQISCVFGHQGINGEQFSINDDLIALANVVDAVERRYPNAGIELYLPYLPYSRQDRAVKPGEANSLKVIGKMINGMGFRSVFTYDAHSPVADAAIDNLVVFDQFDIFKGIYPSFREVYIVAPDEGARKKCESFAERVGAAGVITCAKDRVDGKVVGLKVLDTVPDYANLLVLDDLCDGGRTFIEVSKALEFSGKQNVATIDLAVTHGLFTKGVDVVAHWFNTIYTTDSIKTDKAHQKVKVINL